MKLLKRKTELSFLALALGGLFLCNPIVEFYDVLPDLIGYILICFGLWRLSDYCDDFAQSLRGFRAMMWISAGQLFVQWLLHDFLPRYTRDVEIKGSSINQYEAPVLTLIAAFVWAVLNWYFLVPALKNLFSGFATLAIRSPSSVLLTEKRQRLYWERMSRLSAHFAVLMPLLSLLPEFSVLSTFSVEVDADAFNFYTYVSMFRIVLGVAAGVIGLLWLIAMFVFIVRLMRDKPFCQSLDERYEAEIAPRSIWLLCRRYSLAVILMLVGIVCSADLRVDGYPVVTGTYCVVLLVIGFLLIGHNKPVPCTLLAVGSVGVIALCQYHADKLTAYVSEHAVGDALFSPRAYKLFSVVVFWEFVVAIAVGCFIALFVGLYWHKVFLIEKKIGKNLIQRDKKSYAIKTALAVFFLLAATVMSCVNAVFQLYVQYLWWIELTLTLALFFTLRSLFMDIGDELSSCAKIELENKTEESGAY